MRESGRVSPARMGEDYPRRLGDGGTDPGIQTGCHLGGSEERGCHKFIMEDERVDTAFAVTNLENPNWSQKMS